MYTLRIPFRLQEDQTIILDKASRQVGDLTFELDQVDDQYVLTVSGFATEELAKRHFPSMWASFMWISLNRNLAASIPLQQREITLADEATREVARLRDYAAEDGYVYNDGWSVYISGSQLTPCPSGECKVEMQEHSMTLLRLLDEGVAFRDSGLVMQEDKLRVALELYVSSFREISITARFLTLVMVLEALAVSRLKHEVAQTLLKRWANEIEEAKKTYTAPEVLDALAALKQQLDWRQADSINRQIRYVVESALSGNVDVEQVKKTVATIYDQRSTLLHTGRLSTVELHEAIEQVEPIVKRVLRAKFLAIARDEEKLR